MHSEVSVTLSPQQVFRFDLEGVTPLSNEDARRWLDDQFTQLECEPLRASGKVLLADKVLVVAQAAGLARMEDPEWPLNFARAAAAALPKKVVRVDLPAMAVTY